MKSLKQLVSNRTNWGRIAFVLVFVILSFVYGLNDTMFLRPQSIHIWRQTNSLSIAMNYYQHDQSLFKPQIHNQFCDDGMSGMTAGEFPLIYWSVSRLWKVFGVHEWIFRMVQLIILFGGLFALFEISIYFLKNQFQAAFLSLLLYTSPMFVFYGINFLPDGPSLASMFIGWFYVLQFQRKRKNLLLWVAAFFFTFAIVTKITVAISLIAFTGWVFFEWLFQKKDQRIINFRLNHVFPFVAVIFLSLAWYVYANHYNALHKGEISYFGIWPIWKMTSAQFLEVKDAINKIFFKEYLNPSVQYLTLALWIGLLLRIRKNPILLNWSLVILPLGALSILALWFQVLNGHDYYLITLLQVFAFVWLAVFYAAKNYSWTKHPVVYGLLTIFFAYNVYSCQTQLSNRYKGWMNDWYKNKLEALGEMEPVLQELHIRKEDRVISIPDYSVAASLYLLNRPGYTDFGSDFSKEEAFHKRISQGAKYLIVNDSTILQNEVIQPFIKDPIGTYKNVTIYSLENTKTIGSEEN